MCTITKKEGSGQPSRITAFVKQIVKQQMQADDETTALELHEILLCHGISISLATVLQSRKQLDFLRSRILSTHM